MTETNDLLEKIERGLNELPARAIDDIKAYGKAEFERGMACNDRYAKGFNAAVDIMKESHSITKENNEKLKEEIRQLQNDWSVIAREIEELKDQNKELMRENVRINSDCIQKDVLKICLDNMCLMCATEQEIKGFDACKWMIKSMLGIFNTEEKEVAKDFFEQPESELEKQCGVKIDIDMSPVKKQEPEWYDAEKCFPFFNKYVVLEVVRDDGTIGKVSNVSLQIRGVAQWIAEDNKGHESYIVGKVLKWRYADE